MASRAQDWLKQARSDLLHAQHALEDKDFDWACFACQSRRTGSRKTGQSAEKAAKAVYQHLHSIVWGHSVLALLEGLEQHRVIDASLKDAARRLDKFSIPARYPNGFQEGAPVDYYTHAEAEQAISDARLIVEFSANWIELSDDGRNWRERIPEYLEAFSGCPIPVEVFPFTEAEIRSAMEKGDLFITSIVQHGRELGMAELETTINGE